MIRLYRTAIYIACIWLACTSMFLIMNSSQHLMTISSLVDQPHEGTSNASRAGVIVRVLKAKPEIAQQPTTATDLNDTGSRTVLSAHKNMVNNQREVVHIHRPKLPQAKMNLTKFLPAIVVKAPPSEYDEQIDVNRGNNTRQLSVRVVQKTVGVQQDGDIPVQSNAILINSPAQTHFANMIHIRQKAAEDRYYTMRKTKVNSIDYDLIIPGNKICLSGSPYLLIVVPSIPSHFQLRKVIRSTYGSFARPGGNIDVSTDKTLTVSVKLMFLVGMEGPGGNGSTDALLQTESDTYGDIVQASFQESYYNLTRKMLVALKWVSVYCSEIKYFLKSDEDVFVNIPILVKLLKRSPYGARGSIYGYMNPRAEVIRKGKWAVGRDEFPLVFYPVYASGNSYVISGNIVPKLFTLSEYFPYMPIEDAFITGVLAHVLDAKHVSVRGFTMWGDAAPNPCAFVRQSRVSATKVTSALMLKVWRACQQFDKYCRYNVHAAK